MRAKCLAVACLLAMSMSPGPDPLAQQGPPDPAIGGKGARRAKVDALTSGALNIDRWAVIVGISKYKKAGPGLKDLDYADKDADKFYDLLRKPSGGAFAEDHILKLTNEQATTAEVTKALKTFLKRPGRDDVVFLYFSCHGAPDPQLPGLVYLLTYDTDPDDLSGTAIQMGDVNNWLRQYLKARRLVILADTCHSAAIGGGGRKSSGSDAAAVNAFLREVSKSKEGTAILTSAEANEVALESKQWGGGHGVFTHFLLKGMERDADTDGDGMVTVGELFDYVQAGVRKETGDKQHPWFDPTTLDRKFPMAYIGGQSAREHDRIGRQLFELGRYLDERRPFESAAWHLGEAQRLYHVEAADEREAEAQLARGLALMALDRDDDAVKALSAAVDRGGAKAPADTRLYLGVARARQAWLGTAAADAAAANLETFASNAPSDPLAPWARRLAGRLTASGAGGGRTLALLVGVGHPAVPAIGRTLRGPANDVELVRSMLLRSYGLRETEVTTLVEEGATYEAVTRAVDRLRAETKAGDSVLLYFSGFVDVVGTKDEFNIIPHDGVLAGKSRLIGSEWLRGELKRFAATVTVVADVCAAPSEFGPWLWSWEGVSPHTLIVPIEMGRPREPLERPGEKAYGPLTQDLVRLVTEGRGDRAGDRLTEMWADLDVEIQPTALPGVRIKGQPLRSFLFRAGDGATLFNDLVLRPRRLESLPRLADLYREAMRGLEGVAYPHLHAAFGLAFLERRSYRLAADALTKALAEWPGPLPPDWAAALGDARMRLGRYAEAAVAFEAAAAGSTGAPRDVLAGAAARVKALGDGPVCAMLVGLGHLSRGNLPPELEDVQAVRRGLVKAFGAGRLELTILRQPDATREAILKAFQHAVSRSAEVPTLFYYSGYGAFEGRRLRAILPDDPRPPAAGVRARDAAAAAKASGGITFADLAAAAGGRATNLVTVIDAGEYDLTPPGGRPAAVPPATEPEAGRPDFGRMMVLGGELMSRLPGNGPVAAAPAADAAPDPILARGQLTRAWLGVLDRKGLKDLTYDDWVVEMRRAGPTPVGANAFVADGEERAFSNAAAINDVARGLRRARGATFRALADRLKQLADIRPDLAAELQLDRGIAVAAAGDVDEAVAAFDRSRAKMGSGPDQAPPERPLAREYHYHLGRILHEARKDLSRAVSELDDAVRLDPGDARARYYRGQATRAVVEEDLLRRAREDLNDYLRAGVPASGYEDIERFLGRRGTQARP